MLWAGVCINISIWPVICLVAKSFIFQAKRSDLTTFLSILDTFAGIVLRKEIWSSRYDIVLWFARAWYEQRDRLLVSGTAPCRVNIVNSVLGQLEIFKDLPWRWSYFNCILFYTELEWEFVHDICLPQQGLRCWTWTGGYIMNDWPFRWAICLAYVWMVFRYIFKCFFRYIFKCFFQVHFQVFFFRVLLGIFPVISLFFSGAFWVFLRYFSVIFRIFQVFFRCFQAFFLGFFPGFFSGIL